MTTRIASGGFSTGVSTSASAPRVTASPGRPFTAIMNASASAIVRGAEQAVTRLPGGPILAAAFRPTGAEGATGRSVQGLSARPGASPGASPEGVTGAGGEPGTSGQGADLESVLSEGADKNLYWIGMQERINAESRDYSAWSNVLKARHDTVKNAIGNIR